MLNVSAYSYNAENGDVLFDSLNFSLKTGEKASLIGDNGVGKSVLLAHIHEITESYYLPQNYGQLSDITVGQAIGVADKLKALHAIMNGNTAQSNYDTIGDDWDFEERLAVTLAKWNFHNLDLNAKFDTLSSGMGTKAMLAGISAHTLKSGDIVLLDEPSNHLDRNSRLLLYDFIKKCTCTLLIVSHDLEILNLVDKTYELIKHQGSEAQIQTYGGNYEFYQAQKEQKINALQADADEMRKQLKEAKVTQRLANERKAKLDARGRRKEIRAGTGKAEMNFFKNKAEKSTAKLADTGAKKQAEIYSKLKDIEKEIPDLSGIQFTFPKINAYQGKLLISTEHLAYEYVNGKMLSFPEIAIYSGDRLAISGDNGSGKTTFLRLLIGELAPKTGKVFRADGLKCTHIDQNYSLLNDKNTILEQAMQFNYDNIPEAEVKTKLAQFLFSARTWGKLCKNLSGGERMRLALCIIGLAKTAPDIIVLDEPTNNLDIKSTEILVNALKNYTGTLLIVSHSNQFLAQIGVKTLKNVQN